jgi:hypothetical protein
MKLLGITHFRPFAAVFTLIVFAPLLRSDETTSSPADAYTAAVHSYLNAASREIMAARNEELANEKIGNGGKYVAVRSSLKRCQALLEQLKDAGPDQFDQVKQRYEEARADLLAKMKAARQP